MRILLALLAGLLLLVAGGYAASPWLVSEYAPALARTYGIDVTRLEISRPQWRSLHIEALTLSMDDTTLLLQNATVSYSLDELLEGQLRALNAASLELSQMVAPQDDTGSTPGADSAGVALSPAGVFALVPFQQVRIADLIVRLPALDFSSRGSLHLDDEQLNVELTGLTPALARDLRFSASLTAQGLIEVSASALRSGEAEQFLAVHSQIDGDSLGVTAQLDAEGFPFQLLATTAGAPAGEGRIVVNAESLLPWPVDPDLLPDLRVAGTYQVDWRAADGGISVSELAGKFERGSADIQAVFSGGVLEYSDDELGLKAQIDERLQADWDGELLRLSDGVGYELEVDDLAATGEVHTVILRPLELKLDDAQLSARVSVDGYTHTGELTIAGTLAESAVNASGSWRTGGWTLPLTLTHSLDTAAGELKSAAQLTVAGPAAATLLQGWSELYDLHAGTIDYRARVHWAQQTVTELDVDLSDGRIIYDDYLLSGVAGKMRIRVLDDKLQIEPADMTASLFDPGVPFTSLKSTLALDNNLLRIRDTAFALLGGTVSVGDFVYDLDRQTALNTIDVVLSELELASLLALEGESIRGNGLISGQLPIEINAGLPSISGGAVSALAPGGMLQLSPELTSISGQPGLDFALAALANYRFTSLVAGVDYTEDGELTLAVALQGSNPEVENGRPIHYNLNVTQNVLVLLQSLRAQRAVTEGLERRVLE